MCDLCTIMKKGILFIRGFNTNTSQFPDKHYAYFDVLYNSSKKNEFTFFHYSNSEDIRSVYARLVDVLSKSRHEVVMAHSMGGCLFVKYMSEFPERLRSFKKIVLLMPLISKVAWIDVVSRIAIAAPFIEDIPVFIPAFLSSTALSDNTNITNDFCNNNFSELWVPSKQVVQCYNDIILPPEQLVRLLNGTPQCVLIHASDETVAPIDPHCLAQIRRKVQVQGKHECFNDSARAIPFFAKLAKVFN